MLCLKRARNKLYQCSKEVKLLQFKMTTRKFCWSSTSGLISKKVCAKKTTTLSKIKFLIVTQKDLGLDTISFQKSIFNFIVDQKKLTSTEKILGPNYFSAEMRKTHMKMLLPKSAPLKNAYYGWAEKLARENYDEDSLTDWWTKASAPPLVSFD